jgi:hypothetical protein
MVTKTEKTEEKVDKKVDARQKAWEAFLAKYEKENPVKFASKKDRGEFDKIPANFK